MNLKNKTWYNIRHFSSKTLIEQRAISLRYQKLGGETAKMKYLWDLDLVHRMTDDDLVRFSNSMRTDFARLFEHRNITFNDTPEGVVRQCYTELGAFIRLERCRDRDQKIQMWYLFTTT